MSAVHEVIELLAADRPQWPKAAQEQAARAWITAFQDVPSEVLKKAALAFLKNQRGRPDVAKLMREVRVVQAASRYQRDEVPPWRWDPEEKARIDRELEEKGDPIKDWLKRHDPLFRDRSPDCPF